MDAYTRIVNEVYVQFTITNESSAGIATDVFATIAHGPWNAW
jgi:hypothetical protein